MMIMRNMPTKISLTTFFLDWLNTDMGSQKKNGFKKFLQHQSVLLMALHRIGFKFLPTAKY